MTDVIFDNGISLYITFVALFATTIQILSGGSIYVKALKSLFHGIINMDLLVGIGTGAAWLYGMCLVIVGYNKSLIEDEK